MSQITLLSVRVVGKRGEGLKRNNGSECGRLRAGREERGRGGAITWRSYKINVENIGVGCKFHLLPPTTLLTPPSPYHPPPSRHESSHSPHVLLSLFILSLLLFLLSFYYSFYPPPLWSFKGENIGYWI